MWYPALLVIARHKPMTYWQMTSGAEFWWRPNEEEVLPGGFATQPFDYSEIERVTVYRECCAGKEVFGRDWSAVEEGIMAVEGIRVVLLGEVRPWPTSPPTEALVLDVDDH